MSREYRPAALLLALLSLSAVSLSGVSGFARTHRPAPRRHTIRHGRSSVASRNGFAAARVGIDALRDAPKSILVSKSQKTLTLLENGMPVRTYPIAIGKQEAGAKESAGDWRTPEGLYYVAGHNPASRFYKALRISYPNVEDAARGLRDGLITPGQMDAIRAANASVALPPQDTRLGYDVEIHGGYHLAAPAPGGAPRIRSYTRGCVAVTNTMIDEIYAWAPNGAPILIEP